MRDIAKYSPLNFTRKDRFVVINKIYSFGVPTLFTLLDIYFYYYYQSAGGLLIYEDFIFLLPISFGLQFFDTDVPDEGYSKHVSPGVSFLRVVNVSTRARSLDTSKDIFIKIIS